MKPQAEMALIAGLSTAAAAVLGMLALRNSGAQTVSDAGDQRQPADTATERAELEPQQTDQQTMELPMPPAPTIVPVVEHVLADVGHWRGKPQLADLNGDERLDVVASLRRWDRSTIGDGIHVWLSPAEQGGEWKSSFDGMRRDMGYGGASVADVDGDGDLDIAFSGHDQMPHVFMNDGTAKWSSMSDGIVAAGPCSDVVLADFDLDGTMELAALGFFADSGGLTVFSRDERGVWRTLAEPLPIEDYGSQVRALDLDGDGRPELLAATNKGARVWRFVDGEFVDWSQGLPEPLIGGSDLAVDAADLDGDGTSELLVAGMIYEGHDPLRLFRWSGEAWEALSAGLPADEAFFDASFAQLDGRGPLEIVGAGKFGVSVFAMTEAGVYVRRGRVADTKGVISVGIGDATGDGRDEVVHVGFGGVRLIELPNE